MVVLGDSLVAGYNLPAEEAFPAQLEAALHAADVAVEVVNAGVSGGTTAGGLQRVNSVVEQQPDYVLIVLGGNDLLRGFNPKQTQENLAGIIEILQAANIRVMLAGMPAPLNYGPRFAKQFNGIYEVLAAEYGTALYPSFLEGVFGNRMLMQYDGIHPNTEGVAEIVKRILPDVKAWLEE